MMTTRQDQKNLLSKRFLFGLSLLFMLVVVGCGEAEPTPTPLSTATPLPTALMDDQPVAETFASPAYGIHTSQWWQLDALARDLALTDEMGFGWVKQTFSWRDIEGAEKGQYDWYRPDEIVSATERAGLDLIVRIDRQPVWSVYALEKIGERVTANQPPIDYQDFGDFCADHPGV